MEFLKSASEALPQGVARAPATFGLVAMAVAIAMAAGTTWLEPATWLLWVLFLSGMALFILAFLLSARWAHDERDADGKGGGLNTTGLYLSGVANILMTGLILLGLVTAFLETLAQRNPTEKFGSALGTYVEAAVAEKKEAIPQAAYAVFAACERVRTISDEAERALLTVECRTLLGTPLPLERARTALERAKNLNPSIGSPSLGPSPSPDASPTP